MKIKLLRCVLIPALIWLVTSSATQADSLKVDFNGSSAQTMSGFQAYTAQNEVANSFGSRIYSVFGTTITVTPIWTGSPATNTAQQAQARSAGSYSTNPADMLDLMIDWIGTDTRENPGDPLTLTISGLPAGTYGWKSYHHDTQDQNGMFNVTVNDASGSVTTTGLRISSTQSSTPIVTNLAGVTKFTTAINSDGVNPVSLVFDLTSATSPVSTAFFVMNGFELTNSVVIAPPQTNAALRRPISPNQPMLLVHIDTWNSADPQKIIDLIPVDIRPYVVMNISLSISHNNDTDPGRFNVVEYGYETAKSWIRTCAQNRMWVMVQPSSGGFSHLSDFDLSVYHEFFQSYPNFLGFNYTEQFWGYDNPSDPLSAYWVDRINHFADLLAVCNQYGGYLVVSWCGNQWSPNINPIGMLKRVPAFAAACRNYTENYILCDKFTQIGYQSDMQSLALGAYVSGYAGNWGIRYDDTGWTDVSRTHTNFTMASAGPPYVDHIMDGATVIDGPELIWTQDFREIGAGATDSGFTMRRWERFPQFDNVTIDFFRKLVDGTVRIPTRQEVIDRAKVVIINNVNSGSSDDIYSSPGTLFEGLYRMDGDGNLKDNYTLHKKTGRYPTIPVVYALDDAPANSFQVKVNKSAYATRWPSIAAKTNEFNTLFPQEYTGDISARRLGNQWTVYNPYKVISQTAAANIPFKYNTCASMDLTFSEYTAGIITEVSNKVTFYLGNYDNFVNTALKTDTITINGASSEPTYSWADRASHQASVVSKSWSGGVFTLTVQHNGPLDITVNCAGTATGRLTAFTPATLTPPTVPPVYTGSRQYEGEHFDYKSISGVTKNGFSGILRNYTGQGYLNFGTGSAAAVRDSVNVLNGGTYRLETKYSAANANVSTVDLYVNGVKVATPVLTQTGSTAWATHKQSITLNAGVNTIEYRANGTGASSVYFDNFVVVPTVITGGIVVQENTTGFINVDGVIENVNSGYTGGGYANASNSIGSGINWNLSFDASVIKSFTFRYASTNSSTADLIIRGVAVASKIQFPATGSLTSWENVTVYAYTPAGESAVRLQSTSAAGLPNMDYLAVTGGWIGTPPPTGLNGVAVSQNQVNLSWTASGAATGYIVKRSLTNGGPYSVVATGISTTNYSDMGLADGTMYYYVVSAVSGAGEGSDSTQASVATQSGSIGSLVHRYSFGEVGGASVTDSVGGPVWNGVLPSGGTLAGGQVTLVGASANYVSLPAGIVSTLSNCTIEAWLKLNSTTNWSRIFDFGNNTTTYMFLTPQNSINSRLRFAITTGGNSTEQQIDGPAALAAGPWYHVAVTLNGPIGVLYVNGTPVGTNNSMTLRPSSLGNTLNNYLGKSQWPDPYFNGGIEEFRIYTTALSSSEIAANYAMGPGEVLSPGSPSLSASSSPESLTLSWPLASAGFTVQSRTNLVEGTWANVPSPVPQIVGGQWQVTLPVSPDTNSIYYRLFK